MRACLFAGLLLFGLYGPVSPVQAMEGPERRGLFSTTSAQELLQGWNVSPRDKTTAGALIKAANTADLFSYQAAMESLLSGPADSFVETLFSKGPIGINIYEALGAWHIKDLDTGRIIKSPELHNAALDLLIAITPPLGKRDKNGMTAWQLAKERGNRPLSQVLRKHRRIRSAFDLRAGDDLWGRNIPLAPLEKTALAQAVLKEDPKAFGAALEDLKSGPARDFLSLLHSRTSDGDSIFHLTARISSHKEGFAAGIESLISFIAPQKFYISQKFLEDPIERFWHNAAIVAVGGGMAGFLFTPAYPEAGLISGALSLAGAVHLCRTAFIRNKDTDPIIKSL